MRKRKKMIDINKINIHKQYSIFTQNNNIFKSIYGIQLQTYLRFVSGVWVELAHCCIQPAGFDGRGVRLNAHRAVAAPEPGQIFYSANFDFRN